MQPLIWESRPDGLRAPALVCAFLLTGSNLFVPFAVFFMDQPVKLDFLWAGLCLVGAAYFIFRN